MKYDFLDNALLSRLGSLLVETRMSAAAVSTVAVLASCQVHPTASLEKAKVVSGPTLIERDGSGVFLQYRRATNPEGYTLYYPMDYREGKGQGYYFFYGPVSSFYHGEMVEYPLAYDSGATDLARQGKLFWLNPDGSTKQLTLRKAKD